MVRWGAALPVVLHSSKDYHQEHATERHRLPNNVAAAWGAVI
jgi:hypothetical protein